VWLARVGVGVARGRDPVSGKFIVAPGTTPKWRRSRKALDPSPPITLDGRRRANRRLRAIERALTAEVQRRGRVLDVGVMQLIGHAAIAAFNVEMCRVKREYGEPVEDQVMQRWINASARLLSKLGIKPAFLSPPKPKPAPALSSVIDQQAGS
jgi:hypothetical protein